MATAQDMVRQELGLVLDVLPKRVSDALRDREDVEELLEVVLDLGRMPEARFVSGDVPLDDLEVTAEELGQTMERVGEFGDDNQGRH